MAQGRQLPDKFNLRLVLFQQRPVHPADVVVLAISIVIALLRPREFVAGDHHGCSLREQQSRQHISHLPTSQPVDLRVVGGAFNTAIPGDGIGIAIVICLAVRFIVSFVIGDQVVQRKTIMSGNKIDARPGSATLLIEDVARSAQAAR